MNPSNNNAKQNSPENHLKAKSSNTSSISIDPNRDQGSPLDEEQSVAPSDQSTERFIQTTDMVASPVIQVAEQQQGSITVYNQENACTILTNPPRVLQSVTQPPQENQPGPSGVQNIAAPNNSVILIFTKVNDQSFTPNTSGSGVENNPVVAALSINQPPIGPTVLNLVSDEAPYKITLRNPLIPNVNLNLPKLPPYREHISPPIDGAPPSYSAVLRIGPPETPTRGRRPTIRLQPSPPFIAPLPPPSYAEVQGDFSTRDFLTAFDEYVWGPDSLLIFCPRCAAIVQTNVLHSRSTLTHFSALALCLCGCWPCCLLPYCMKSCKNTYHYCPHCQQFLGMYSPW